MRRFGTDMAGGEDRAAAIAAAFVRSPFLLEDHAAAMAALWGLPPVAAPARIASPPAEPVALEPLIDRIEAVAQG